MNRELLKKYQIRDRDPLYKSNRVRDLFGISGVL